MFKYHEMRLVYHFKMLKTMLSERLKLDVGPILTILSYLFKQLEMGLVCHFKMLKTMLSEKLILTYLLKYHEMRLLYQCFAN